MCLAVPASGAGSSTRAITAGCQPPLHPAHINAVTTSDLDGRDLGRVNQMKAEAIWQPRQLRKSRNRDQLGHDAPRTARCSRIKGWAMPTLPWPFRRCVVWLPALSVNFCVRLRKNRMRRMFPMPTNRSRSNARASTLVSVRQQRPCASRSSIAPGVWARISPNWWPSKQHGCCSPFCSPDDPRARGEIKAGGAEPKRRFLTNFAFLCKECRLLSMYANVTRT